MVGVTVRVAITIIMRHREGLISSILVPMPGLLRRLGDHTPTPLEPTATAPSTEQMTVPSAQTAATVESLSVLIAPTRAPPYPGCYG